MGFSRQEYWNSTCTSSFRIRNGSTGILSPPLALFIIMLPKAHLTLNFRMSGALNSSLMQGSTRRSALQKEELSLAPAERWPQRGARERRAESDAGSTRTERDCRPGRGPTHVDHQAGRGRGRGQPTSLANHCDPRWPCPPHGPAYCE